MCPASQVSVLKRQRSGLNQLIKMLQFPFPPLLRPLSGTFRQNQSLNCFFFLKKKVYLWTLQGVWPALEIAPRSILSVIKALKSAAGWFSQIYAALNKTRGMFIMPLTAFRAPRSLLDGASQGDAGRFSIRAIFVHFIRFSTRKKIPCVLPPAPSRLPLERTRPCLCSALPGRWEPRGRRGPDGCPGAGEGGQLARRGEPLQERGTEPLRALGPSR